MISAKFFVITSPFEIFMSFRLALFPLDILHVVFCWCLFIDVKSRKNQRCIQDTVRALSFVTDLVSAKYMTDDGNFDVKQNSKQTFAFLFYLKKKKNVSI